MTKTRDQNGRGVREEGHGDGSKCRVVSIIWNSIA
jgi:hypothetical protein